MKEDISQFEKVFEKLAFGKSESTIFDDFLDIVIYALSGERYEEEYLSIMKKYKREEVDLFSKLFAHMVIIMDNDGSGLKDYLGEFFQTYITKGRHGQFFTPEHVCDMMAAMTMDKGTIGKTIIDPSCGSGRMLLSAAKVERHNTFYAADIDQRCCKMTAINLCLNGLAGEVAWMDSLSWEHWGGYRIFFDNKRLYLPTIEKLKAQEGYIYSKPKLNNETPEPTSNIVRVTQAKFDF
jgi:type I restriction-modification system DNA methylase subunit